MLEKWSDEWLLKFNPRKCKVMYCGNKNSKTEYYMTESDKTLKKVEETLLEKDLGVYISDTLKATSHCQKAASRGMSALRLMRLSFDQINKKNFKILYTTYVRPHIEYCMQAVGPHTVQDIKSLERVQRRATKLVKEFRNLSYEERLRRLQLPTVEDRLNRGDMIETYKLLTRKVKVDYRIFLSPTLVSEGDIA